MGRLDRRAITMAAVALAALSAPLGVSAQSATELAERFVGLTAVTGFEGRMADAIVELVPGAVRDRAGSAVVILGAGDPVRLAVCPMDESGYIVGRVLDEGFLRLRRVGGGVPPLFDQSIEGHRVTVWSRNGQVPGVVSIPSTHLGRGRDSIPDRPFNVDEAYVDLGVASAEAVAALGVRLLDPVALASRGHRYGASLLAGPAAGQRAACAALARAAIDSPDVEGTIVVAFVVESRLRHSGLQVVSNGHGPFAETWLVDYDVPDRMIDERFGTVERSRLPVRFEGFQIETVDLTDVEALSDRLIVWMGGRP